MDGNKGVCVCVCVCVRCYSAEEWSAESHSVQKNIQEEKCRRSTPELLQRPEGELVNPPRLLFIYAFI